MRPVFPRLVVGVEDPVKERPILFTGPSIPMVMDGTKTQTRRIADPDRLSVDLPSEIRSDLWDIMPKSQRMVAKKGRHRATLNPGQHGGDHEQR